MEYTISKGASYDTYCSRNDNKGFISGETKWYIDANDTNFYASKKGNDSHDLYTEVLPGLSYSIQNVISEELGTSARKVTSSEVSDCETINSVIKTKYKVHRYRFIILFLFSLCSLINGFQWIQFAIMTSTMTCYYNVSATAVNWTSLIFMAVYLPLAYPGAWFMHAKGLRVTIIIGAFFNCLSSCIQCLSLAPNRFYVVMISQAVAALSQNFILSVPPSLAATWFGPKEVSLACAFGVFGNQLGNALGFLIPPILVSDDCMHKMHITSGLRRLAYGLTAVNTLLFLVVLCAFKNKPKQPPSLAEANKPEVHSIKFKEILNLLKSPQYLLLFTNYGILVSVYFAIGTLLNQIVIGYFPGREVDAGWIGLISVFTGMFGSMVYGFILDKTFKFREISITINVMGLIAMVIYTCLAHLKHLWIHYVMVSVIGIFEALLFYSLVYCVWKVTARNMLFSPLVFLLGILLRFFMCGYVPVGLEYGSEITYPQPEGNSASLLNSSIQLYGLIITAIATWLLQNYGVLASNLFFCGCAFVAFLLCVFLKAKLLRRQEYEVIRPLDES